MIHTRITSQGAIELSAEVTHPRESFSWYESRQFMGYTKREALQLFREYLKANNLTITK